MSSYSDRQRGFTLLELLVSMTVFAIMSVMAYGGLKNVIDNSEATRDAMQRLEQVQKTVSAISRDLSQIYPRDIINTFGDPKQYLIADDESELIVEFTRSGRRNPAGLPRSSLQRVAYRTEDNKLYRVVWTSLDQAQGEDPLQAALIDEVESLELRYRDDSGKWHDEWPPLAVSATPATPKLVTIEFVLELTDWGKINRVFEVLSI